VVEGGCVVVFANGFSSRFEAIILAIICILNAAACGVIKEKPKNENEAIDFVGKPIPPEKAEEVLSEVGSNFVYGPSLGETAVNVGTVVLFPPYALYLVGNAILSLSGYEPVTVSGFLPEEEGKAWSNTFDDVVSGPGKVAAAIAGKEYRSRQLADARMEALLADLRKPVPAAVGSDPSLASTNTPALLRSDASRSESLQVGQPPTE